MKHLTPHSAAPYMRLHHGTVRRACKRGHLKHYRIGSTHIRFTIESAIEFCRKNGIPTDLLEAYRDKNRGS